MHTLEQTLATTKVKRMHAGRCPRCRTMGSKGVRKATYSIGFGRWRTADVCAPCYCELKGDRAGQRTVYTIA